MNKSIQNSNDIGSWGEEQASVYLKNKGYTILKRNFRSKFGEIDIIAVKNKLICFIEVKTRQKSEYGFPAEAVNYSKQQKLIRTAEYYLCRNFSEDYSYRFDVIELFHYNRYIFALNHLKGAFEL